MKNILEILKANGIEVPEDKVKPINDAVTENYRTINDYNTQKTKLETAKNDLAARDKTINELNEQIENAGTDAKEIETMRKTIADYKKAEEERKAADEEAAKKGKFEPKFVEALGERKFSNDLVAESVKAKAYEKSSANPDMDVKQIIDDLTKDMQGVFTNPQGEPHSFPKPKSGEGGKLNIATIDDINKLTEKEINENWEQVSKILKQ